MNNIALGRYIPMNSVIHKLDPRYKIIAMFILLVAVFLPTGFQGYGILAVFVLGTLLLAKLKLNFIMQSNEADDVHVGLSACHQYPRSAHRLRVVLVRRIYDLQRCHFSNAVL